MSFVRMRVIDLLGWATILSLLKHVHVNGLLTFLRSTFSKESEDGAANETCHGCLLAYVVLNDLLDYNLFGAIAVAPHKLLSHFPLRAIPTQLVGISQAPLYAPYPRDELPTEFIPLCGRRAGWVQCVERSETELVTSD
ncbi:hypothetical protein LguiB_000888 [Lonicera macranthoides]